MDIQDSIDERMAERWAVLIQASVREILRVEEADAFLDWMRKVPMRQFRDAFPSDVDPALLRGVLTQLDIRIWNATPLPSHGFRPDPLPKPGRNDLCSCGSGRKYKQCCQLLSADLPSLDPEQLWGIVIEQLSAKDLERAVKAHQIPREALGYIASRDLVEGRASRAVKLLEPLFENRKGLDERHAEALLVLCDAYDALGHRRKKQAVLNRVAHESQGQLAADAWQRLATIRIDQGNLQQAREALEQARQQASDDPALMFLEVTLLLKEGQEKLARERARFWIGRLHRLGYHDPQSLAFLEQVANDPTRAMTDIYLQASAPGAKRLLTWLESVQERQLPHYQVVAPRIVEPEQLAENLRKQLLGMGVSRNTIDQQVEDLLTSLSESADDAQVEESGSDESMEDLDRILEPPKAIQTLEEAWHRVYPAEKPFSTGREPMGGPNPWEPQVFEQWMSFLEAKAGTFDSLDILDDLLIACRLLGMEDLNWVTSHLMRPLYLRAEAIVRTAIAAEAKALQLPWGITENRPALRLLAAAVEDEDWETPRNLERLKWLIKLNPNDNHGFRGPLVNALLKRGQNEDAVEVAKAYPDDRFPETLYGRILAAIRLERWTEATESLRQAVTHLPKVAHYLTARRVRQPRLNPDTMTIGGDDQAWFYRSDMREVWASTPGALDWLREESRRIDARVH